MIVRRTTTAVIALGLVLLQPVPGVAMCLCPHPDAHARDGAHPMDACRQVHAAATAGADALTGALANRAAGCPSAERDGAPAGCCENGPTGAGSPGGDETPDLHAPRCATELSAGTAPPDLAPPVLAGAHPSADALVLQHDVEPPPGGPANSPDLHRVREAPRPLFVLTASYRC